MRAPRALQPRRYLVAPLLERLELARALGEKPAEHVAPRVAASRVALRVDLALELEARAVQDRRRRRVAVVLLLQLPKRCSWRARNASSSDASPMSSTKVVAHLGGGVLADSPARRAGLAGVQALLGAQLHALDACVDPAPTRASAWLRTALAVTRRAGWTGARFRARGSA